MTSPEPVERRFSDGRLAEVLDLGAAIVVRVHAPSGGVYIEQHYSDLAKATAAITEWDGEGLPPLMAEPKRT